MADNTIYCPVSSAGNEVPVICMKEACAWYLNNYKKCAVFVLAHDAALNIQEKQAKK